MEDEREMGIGDPDEKNCVGRFTRMSGAEGPGEGNGKEPGEPGWRGTGAAWHETGKHETWEHGIGKHGIGKHETGNAKRGRVLRRGMA